MRIDIGDILAVIGAFALFFALVLPDIPALKPYSGWLIFGYVFLLALVLIKVEQKEKTNK